MTGPTSSSSAWVSRVLFVLVLMDCGRGSGLLTVPCCCFFVVVVLLLARHYQRCSCLHVATEYRSGMFADGCSTCWRGGLCFSLRIATFDKVGRKKCRH